MQLHLRTSGISVAVAATVAAIAFATSTASADEYVLADSSVVSFTCRGAEITQAARGRFGALSGRLEFNPGDLTVARGAMDVVLASITTDDSGWDAMFRRAPFLALDEFPRARFSVTGLTRTPVLRPNHWTTVELVGRMSLHGLERDMRVPARLRWAPQGSAREDGSRRSHDELEVRAELPVSWEAFAIRIPAGSTRTFAGDGALVSIELTFRRKASRRR